jgi:DNA-binding NtrC family response regulator
MALSLTTSSSHSARLLLVQPTVSAVLSLIPLFDDQRLGVEYELSTSHESAMRKLFRSSAPYRVVVCDTQLADIQKFLLLTQNRTVHPSVPFIVTAREAEHKSARRALHEGALDFIPAPLDQEQAVKTIRRALWHNWLRRLIAQKETATAKYREHMAAYPHDQRIEDAFRRACEFVETSLAIMERSGVWVETWNSLSDIATGLETQTRTQALIRLDAWQP